MCKSPTRSFWDTHELHASLNPFSIAGIYPDGITEPMIIFSNSNLVGESMGRGSIYLSKIIENHLK